MPHGSPIKVLRQADEPLVETKTASAAPSPRVGSASTSLNGRMYIFSGSGGVEMAPVEEHGALWAFNPTDTSWSKLEPSDPSQPYPPARSYHCMANDGENSIFVNAGCPEEGRLSDLWRFDLTSRKWARAPDAPGPQRGGASLAFSGGKIYRMNGFDGTTEQGGCINVFDVSSSTWSTKSFPADGNAGPEPRSVCTLLPLRLQGKEKLVTLFGERDPSSLGHAGAGKMLGDVWMYDIAENWWTKAPVSAGDSLPDPRGWFAADVVKGEHGNPNIVVHGGLGEDNTRLADVWLLTF